MAIPEPIVTNFQTMRRAAEEGNLALLETKEIGSGIVRYMICGIQHIGREYAVTPFGIVFDETHGNPYEFFATPMHPSFEKLRVTEVPVTPAEEKASAELLDSLTDPQYLSLLKKWRQDHNGKTLPDFINSVKPTIGMNGAVIVQWCGMWLAIEGDGYVHS